MLLRSLEKFRYLIGHPSRRASAFLHNATARARDKEQSFLRRMIVILSIAFGLFVCIWLVFDEIRAQRLAFEQMQDTANASFSSIAMNVYNFDYPTAQSLAMNYVKNSKVVAIQIVDRYGFEIVSVGDFDRPTTRLEKRERFPLYYQRSETDNEPTQIGTVEQIIKVVPLSSMIIDGITKALLISIIFGLSLGLILHFYIRFYVTDPLEKFFEAVARTHQTGEYSRVSYLAETKLGVFARGFNMMMDALEQKERARTALLQENSTINQELRNANEVLRQEKRVKIAQFIALGKLLEHQEIALTFVDPSGDVIFTNGEHSQIAAIREVLHKPVLDLKKITEIFSYTGFDCELIDRQQCEISPGNGFELEVSKEETGSWVLLVGPKTRDGRVMLCVNVTNLRNKERSLLHKQKMEALGRLVGGVAHEFNNMLSIVVTNLDLLSDTPREEAETANQIVDSAQRAAGRAAAVVTQLLTYARRNQEKRQSIDVATHFDGLLAMLSGVLGPGVQMSAEIEDDLYIHCNPDLLDTTIVNLATNARDAMMGKGEFRISAKKRAKDSDIAFDSCRITVEDTGCGIPSAIIDKVFDPFFSTKSSQGKGVGLGLSAVLGFVEASDGHISVGKSEALLGTKFVIDLPLTKAPARAPKPMQISASGIEGRRCLILEDSRELSQTIVTYLERKGFQCFAAYSLSEALDKLEGEDPHCFDLLYCDLQLPDGRGTELIEPFMDKNPAATYLLASGCFDGDSFADGHRENHIAKPFSLNELGGRVGELLAAQSELAS